MSPAEPGGVPSEWGASKRGEVETLLGDLRKSCLNKREKLKRKTKTPVKPVDARHRMDGIAK